MNITRIAGITIVIVGAVLLAIGYDATDAPVDQLSEAITGRYTDRTMWYLVVGIAAVVGGGLLTAFGRPLR